MEIFKGPTLLYWIIGMIVGTLLWRLTKDAASYYGEKLLSNCQTTVANIVFASPWILGFLAVGVIGLVVTGTIKR